MSSTRQAKGAARGLTRYRAAEGAKRVELGSLLVPERFTAETTLDFGEPDDDTAEGLMRPYEVITWVIEDGRAVVESYWTCRWPGHEVTDSRLKDRGLEAMADRALDRLAWGAGGPVASALGVSAPGDRQARRRSVEGMMPKRGRPRVSDEAVERAAAVYLEAVARGDRAPTRAVEDALDLDRGAARLRVKRARDAGLIPPATKTKDGQP